MLSLRQVILCLIWWQTTPVLGTVEISPAGIPSVTGVAPVQVADPTTTPVVSIPASDATHDGYLKSTDWVRFDAGGGGGGSGTVTSVSGSTPLHVATPTTTPALTIDQAGAAASGYLSSTDWLIFNAKQPAGSYVLQSTAVNTTSPLTGGGNLSTSRTISIPAATLSVDGYLSSSDWATFNGKQPAGSYALQSTAISTTGPLTGGGDLSTTRTLSLPASGSSADGYLSSSDWLAFNAKQHAIVPVQQKVWVTANGDDGTGALGDISRPFATLGAAEAAITDAADVKHYEVVVGPGTFDLLGVVWKSYVYFHGSGIDTTQLKTSDNSTWDMTNAGMSTGVNALGLEDLQVVTPAAADLYSIGGSGRTHYSFENVVFSAGVTMSGRGGEDNVMNYTVRYDAGFDITSMSINGTGIATSAATALRANHGLGAQWIAAGAIVLATMTVQDMDNSSFCLFGGNGIILGGSGLIVDGATASAYIDSGALVGGGITQTNGASVVLNSVAKYVAYTPASSSLWNTVPSQVASALDLMASGELRPSSWTVAGPINGATSTTDAATAAGVFTAASHVTTDGDITVLGMNASASAVIDSGATDGKALAGGVYTVTRGDHTDTGTQHEMDGTQVLLFHQPDTAGVTDKAKGYALTSFAFGGTITNLYDFYSEYIPAGGAVTNHYGLYLSGASGTNSNWGIYATEATAANWLHGTLKLGSGDTVTDPGVGVEIAGRLDQPVTGAVSVSAGTPSVTGSGSNFGAELAPGAAIEINGETHEVASVEGPNNLTLSANHSGGASGVTAHMDGDFYLAKNGNGTTMFKSDRAGNLFVKGDLQVNGSFTQSQVAATNRDTYSDPVTGTVDCDGSGNCTGTGTAFLSELHDGDPIQDPENNTAFLFVNHVSSDTVMTLITTPNYDVFGYSGVSLFHQATPHQVIFAQTAFFNDGSHFEASDLLMNNTGSVSISKAWGLGPALTVQAGNNNGTAPITPALQVYGDANVGGYTKLGNAGVAFANMGACTIASTTLSTTATNLTCTGVPASASVAIQCSGQAAFSTPIGNGVYCRATGTADQVACNTAAANVTAMAFSCSWVQP